MKKTFLSPHLFTILLLFVCAIASGQSFTSIWDTTLPGTSSSNQITIPTNPAYTYSYTIDWGDGMTDTGVTGDITHTYSAAGSQTISISGNFPAIYFNNAGDRRKIIEITGWGNIQWQSMENAFYGCENLNFDAITAPDLSQVTSLKNTFRKCSSFNGVLNLWDLSTITDISGMFYTASIFNRPLDNWNVINVTDMSDTFNEADDFNEPINGWNTGNVTNMARMFRRARAFNQNINSWNVAQVTDMSNTFEDCKMNFPLNLWIVDNVTTMESMFEGSRFDKPIDNWNTSNVTNMAGMFAESDFNHPLAGFDVEGVTDMSRMFYYNDHFNQPINNWNVSNVTDMSYMFGGYYQFYITVFDQPLDLWDVSNVTNMSGMFQSSHFNQPIEMWNITNVTNMSQMFDRAEDFNQPLEGWSVENVTNMSQMFEEAFVFNQPLNSWDISSVTNLSNMFNKAPLFNQNLDNWVTSSVTNMSSMFKSANSFNQNLGVWDISQVTFMSGMLDNSGISEVNYDNSLIGWASQTVLNDVTLGADSLLYCEGRFARQDLIDNYGWSIVDDIINCSFAVCTEIISPVEGDILVPANFNLVWEAAPVATGYRLTVTKDTGGTVTTVLDNLDVFNTLIYDFPLDFTPGDIVTAKVTPYNVEGPAEDCETISFTIVAPWVTSPDAFKLTFNTSTTYSGSTAANQLEILTNSSAGTYNYAIDWGDGQYNNNVSQTITHTYETPGVYQIAIIGEYPAHYYNNTYTDARKLLTIDQWGTGSWQTMRQAFGYTENMTYNASDIPDLSQVTSMSYMFYEARNFNGNIDNWITTNVIDMSGLFSRAVLFDQPLNSWDVSNVTNMTQMFSGNGTAMIFNQPLDSWDVSNVTNMYFMFYNNEKFNQPLNEWDVSNVTSLGYMFGQADDFNQPLDAWDVNNVTDMSAMFIGAQSFNQNIENWETSSCTNMRYMFNNADSFNQPLNAWDVSNVQNMEYMFSSTDLFNQPLGTWDTSSVTNMESMFENTLSFDNEISFWNVSNVNTMESMFRNSTLFNQDISNWNVTNVLTMESMFENAQLFNQPLQDWLVDSVVTMESMFENAQVFNQPIANWDASAVATMSSMFKNAQLFDQSINDWDTSSVTIMTAMFENAQVFNQTINDWDVSNVTSYNSMFQNAQLFNMPLDNWLTDKAQDLAEMFRGALAFNQNIDSWNTSFVTTMQSMFQDAEVYNQPMDSWNTASVTTMESMFEDAIIFNQNIDPWNTRSVTNMREMFRDAVAFNQPLNNWRVRNVSTMEYMFRDATSFNQLLDEWDLEEVSMRSMFHNATSYDQLMGDWDMSQVTNLNDMLDYSGMSRMNYDNTIIAWAEQTLPSGLTLGAQNVPYCDAFEERAAIIASYGWTFSGDVLDCPIPECTTLISPFNTEIDVPINTNLTWEPAVFARGYRLTVTSVPANANNVTNITLIDQTSYNFSNDFSGGEVVTVTITPFNDTGDAMSCTPEVFTIITSPIPVAPDCTSLTSPLNNATEVAVTTDLFWEPVSNADSYEISVGTTMGGFDILNSFNVGNVTTHDLMNDLPENTLIYVTITPINEVGPALNCDEESFTTEIIPVPPTCTSLTMPLDGAIEVPLDTDITWSATPDTTGYLLTVGTTYGGNEVLNAIDVGNMPTYSPLTDLDPGDTYYVFITPYNNIGDATGCIIESFTTEIPSNVIAMCMDITVQLDASGTATIEAVDVDAGSSDPDGPVTLSIDVNSFDCSNIGENSVTLTVTDNANNIAMCQATVTIEDSLMPTIDCIGTQTEEISMDCLFVIPDYAALLNITDNCTPTITQTPVAGSEVGIGTTLIMVVATDGTNTNTCTFNLEVVDTTPPVVSCIDDFTLALDINGTASIDSATLNNGSSDFCGVTITSEITNFTCDHIGENTLTLLVTDGNGLTNTCTTIITITDPLFSCDALPIAQCQPLVLDANENCMAITTAEDFDLGSFDPDGNTLTFSVTPEGPYALGVTNVTLTVNDGNLSASCDTTITVNDTTPPTLTCPENQIEEVDDTCLFSIPDYTLMAIATDNCVTPILTQNPPQGTTVSVGDTIITITANDGTNTTQCTFTLTTQDNAAPQAMCQNITVELDANGTASITALQVDAGSLDNCGIADVSIDIDTFNCSNIGDNNVVLTVTDINGNLSTCTAVVTVVDNVAPVAVCQNITVTLDELGFTSIAPADLDGGSSDACGIASLTIDVNEFTCDDEGENEVTLTITDNNGNVSTCTAIVTVNGASGPTAICQNITTPLDESGSITISAEMLNNGSFDDCTTDLEYSVNVDTFTCENIGENTVTLTVTDSGGNTDTCEAVITIIDDIAPTVICQNIEVQFNEEGDPIVITPDMIDNGSTDNCTIISYELDVTTFNCNNLGENEVQLSVTDASGNIATCTATVTVNAQNAIPVAMCQNVTVVLDTNGMATITPQSISANNVADICGNTLTIDIDTFTCEDANSIIPVTLTVTNASGESASCIADVFVIDNLAPTIICPEQTVIIAAIAPYELPDFVANGTITVVDNCTDQMTVTQEPAMGTFVNEGETEINITITDPSGNSVSCEFDIFIDPSLAINTSEILKTIKLFPNPTIGSFSLSKPESLVIVEMTLLDISGRKIKSFNITEIQQNTFSVSGLASATYFVNIITENGNKMVQLIKS